MTFKNKEKNVSGPKQILFISYNFSSSPRDFVNKNKIID